MSANVKTRAGSNPLQKQTKAVAKTYGERRIRKDTDVKATRTATPKKLDQFSRKGAKPGSLAAFGNKAAYVTKGRLSSRETPYKALRHDQTEKGTAPRNDGINAERPSDQKLLNFLNWIDNNEHAHNSNRFRAACKRHAQNGNSVATTPKKTRLNRPTNKAKA